MVWLLVALALDRVQLKLGAFSYNAQFHGYGTIDAVNRRNTIAPMQYRVLLPWLVWLAERVAPGLRKHRLPLLYEPLKIGLMAAALWACEQAIGVRGALLVAALLPMIFLFDYWDWCPELFALAAALAGNFPLALLGGVAHALSRETAPLTALTYGLATGDWRGAVIIGGAIGLTMGLLRTRLWAGWKPLYCKRVMFGQTLKDLRAMLNDRPVYSGETAMSLLLLAATAAALVKGVGPTWPVPLAIMVAGCTLARIAETRMFAACLLWVAAAFMK